MRIIPAIDVLNGNCVRLLKGDYDQSTEYSTDPAAIGVRFSRLAVADLHIVDLDGARTGSQQNQAIVTDIASQTGLAVQLGGGIRSKDDIERWLNAGVRRCVIGSAAVRSPERVISWMEDLGADKIVLALDVRLNDKGVPLLATDGWTEDSRSTLWDCLDLYTKAGAEHVLCTDIDRDGTLQGPNSALYQEIMRHHPGLRLQASGGVRNMLDLYRLRRLGLPAAITGRALLDGDISENEVTVFQRSA